MTSWWDAWRNFPHRSAEDKLAQHDLQTIIDAAGEDLVNQMLTAYSMYYNTMVRIAKVFQDNSDETLKRELDL